VWPSGKAAVFGIAMRRFESCHPSHRYTLNYMRFPGRALRIVFFTYSFKIYRFISLGKQTLASKYTQVKLGKIVLVFFALA
jgi:hypothetical protein